ncbi:hypothetical protein [Bythopirellula goksoeyrii]|uniref:Uncharacterized protein n=1 Tax=Bythopirellula goksoeyrii TaxID=1400387 RepID=A0A5B9QFA0_9BACT|nr:hypothetical protein [Bythopirellula goksoeyrii]QEG36212.1 hypothetical protein Pr1d_35240 [Bythopirellula goksoeyrii]
MTAAQLADYFYFDKKHPQECAYRVIRKLSQRGLAMSWQGMVCRLELNEPLLRWSPGSIIPEISQIAWQNEKRWKMAVPTRTICITATAQAVAEYGGHCREPRPREVEHDINLAEVFLRLDAQSTLEGLQLTPEDSIPHDNQKRPDALLERNGEQIVIDLLGRGYSKQKIQTLWQHYREVPLELW